jgi:hypothetical protein
MEAQLELRVSLLQALLARVASLLAQTEPRAWVAPVVTKPAQPVSSQLESVQVASLASVVLALPLPGLALLAWPLVVAKLADPRPDSREQEPASVQQVSEQQEANSWASEDQNRHPQTPDANWQQEKAVEAETLWQLCFRCQFPCER